MARYIYVVSFPFPSIGQPGCGCLYAIDVINPADISIVGRSDYDYPLSVSDISGYYAYVAFSSTSIFRIFDVSCPFSPEYVNTVSLDVPGSLWSGLQDIICHGDNWVLAAGGTGWAGNPETHSLHIWAVDVTDKSNPVETNNNLGSYWPVAQKCYINGNRLYVANIIRIGDDNDEQDRISSYDISNLPTVSHVETLQLAMVSYPFATWAGIAGTGNYIFVSFSNQSKIWSFDVTNPNAMVELDCLDIVSYPNSLAVKGNYLYVSIPAEDKIKVIDITNPAVMVEYSTFTDAQLDKVRAIKTDPYSNVLYAVCPCDTPEDDRARVTTVDISNPSALSVLDSIFSQPLHDARSVVILGVDPIYRFEEAVAVSDSVSRILDGLEGENAYSIIDVLPGGDESDLGAIIEVSLLGSSVSAPVVIEVIEGGEPPPPPPPLPSPFVGQEGVFVFDQNGVSLVAMLSPCDYSIVKELSKSCVITVRLPNTDNLLTDTFVDSEGVTRPLIDIGNIIKVYRSGSIDAIGCIVGPLNKINNPVEITAFGPASYLERYRVPVLWNVKAAPAVVLRAALKEYRFKRLTMVSDFDAGTYDDTQLLELSIEGENRGSVILDYVSGGAPPHKSSGYWQSATIDVVWISTASTIGEYLVLAVAKFIFT